MLCGTALRCHTKALQFRVWRGRSSPHSDHCSQHASQHVHRHTRRGRAVRDDKRLPHREPVTSSPRRTKRPSTLTVGKVGWSVERETWCRLTLERQPSAGAGLALHQSRISMREIRASQTLDLLWHADANRTKGGLKISRAPASSGKTGPPAPRAPTRGGRGGYKCVPCDFLCSNLL